MLGRKKAAAMSDEPEFGLDKVLEALGHDLVKAQVAAEKGGFGLVVGDAEVEISFTVEKAREGGGGVNLKVFGVGVGGGATLNSSQASVHRITLKLHPKNDDTQVVAGPPPPKVQ
jgi:hypothetical protein